MLLYDKEFSTKSDAMDYCELIMEDETYYADFHFDQEYNVWVVEVWK